MTLTKNSTIYSVLDLIGEVNVNGSVQVNEEGTINININTDNEGYASFSRGNDGMINFNANFNESNDLIDYVQTLVNQIMQELAD